MTNESMNAHLAAAEKNLQDAAVFGDEPAKMAILEALRVIRALRWDDDLDRAIRDEHARGLTEQTGARMADYLRSAKSILRDRRIPPPQ
jgi:hypothetical protein